MKSTFQKIVEYFVDFKSLLITLYATWRINPTKDEKHAYNTTNKILLTFDDFADEKTIKLILDILKNEKVKAAFFLIGDWAAENPRLVNEIKKAGHWVGNHTKTHANLLKISDAKIRKEILGGPASKLLRPPYGCYNKKVRNIAKELGYKICYWNIDSDDWKGIFPDAIEKRIFNSLQEGACILMHLNGKYTVDVLPKIIKGIKERGYQLCQDGKELDYA
ncbi:polysaccharide deacetylase family protein [Candidatus Roizmanbacteria bacterium]|nr:polysaccharide deacetylase family protein [Candidatus Roizmanbacteria bacterium]